MILNAFSVLAGFLALLRGILAIVLLVLAVRALRRRRTLAPESTSERGLWLMVSLSTVLFGLCIVSWPLLYLALQSFVPEWPGVMCIQGVTQVGSNSVGPARHLPGLLGFLQASKPALVFLAGAWLVLHRARKGVAHGTQTVPALLAVMAFGMIAVSDASAEMTYFVIPKAETFLAAGCCAVRTTTAVHPGAAPTWLAATGPSALGTSIAFFGVGAAVLGALFLARRSAHRGRWLAGAAVGAAVSVPVALGFLNDVAAPAFLRLPQHRCAYCMITSAPESLVGISLFLLGAFAVGWAVAARAWGADASKAVEKTCVSLAMFGYGATLAMAAMRLAA